MDSYVDAHGDVWFYAAFTRNETSGTAHVAIELLNSAADCTLTDHATCNPWENRTDGTRIIGFTWQGNDGLVAPTLWEWTGSGFAAGQPLGSAFSGSTGNGGAFGEMAVNLTAAGILPNVNDPTAACELIAAVIPLTLPGFSLGSQPKDVVLGTVPPIQTCGSLKIEKVVAGGDDFGDDIFVGEAVGDTTLTTSPPLGHGDSQTFLDVKAGSFTVSEKIGDTTLAIGDTVNGWTLTNIDCGDGTEQSPADTTAEVVVGETTTCTLYNSPDLPTLTLEKTVVNNWGGEADESHFTPRIDGSTSINETAVAWDVAVPVSPGAHTASEEFTVGGYTAGPWGGDCDADGSLTEDAVLGGDYVCTITNSDTPGGLRLVKAVEDPDGLYPDIDQDDFDPLVDGSDTIPAHEVDSEELQAAQDVEWYTDTPDNTLVVPAGEYTPGEDDTTGPLSDGRFFQESIACDDTNGGATATVPVGEIVTCTITNVAVGAGLTLVKNVTNAWGGALEAGDFTLRIDGEAVTQGDTSGTFPAGTYDISEDGQDGYDLVRVTCTELVDDQQVTILDETDPEELADLLIDDLVVGAGDTVVCTFYNEDRPGELTVVKDVINDDGGTATEDDFTSDVEFTVATGGEVAAGNEPDTSPAWGGDRAAGTWSVRAPSRTGTR